MAAFVRTVTEHPSTYDRNRSVRAAVIRDSLWIAEDLVAGGTLGIEQAFSADVSSFGTDASDPDVAFTGIPPNNLVSNGDFGTGIVGWTNDPHPGYSNSASIAYEPTDGSGGAGCLEVSFSGADQEAFRFTLPPELVLSSATIYTLTFFVRRVSGNGALWAGFGSTVPFGDAYQDWFYPPEAFRECVVGQSVPFSVDIDVPALLFSSAGTNVGTIRIDAVRFESDSPVTGHRTAWLKAVVPARKTLAVDTDGSDYDIALVLWEWDGASTPTSHLTWDATPGTARIRYPVNPGTYLIEASAFDDTAGSLVLNATLDAASYGSAGLLLRGVGGAQFTSVRPSDTGGIGTMTSARPFDVVAPQLHKTSRRPFDVSGTVRQTSSRPFDLGTGGLLVLSQRPFDVIDPNQPIDPIIIVPPNPDPVNAVQQILITNHTGTFLITFMGQTTVPLAWNAAPATVQAALEDLAAISPGDVVVTAILGGFQLAFAGAYAGIPVAPVSVALAGGVTVTMRPGIHHTYYLTIRNDASQLKASQSVTVTADAEVEFYVDVLGVSDNVVDIVLDASTIEAFYIVSDKDVTMTENDDGSPDLTVALTAGVPYWWYGGFGANPFSVDLTSLKFANAGATSAHVRAAFLVSA